jgi:hypothetical protein
LWGGVFGSVVGSFGGVKLGGIVKLGGGFIPEGKFIVGGFLSEGFPAIGFGLNLLGGSGDCYLF